MISCFLKYRTRAARRRPRKRQWMEYAAVGRVAMLFDYPDYEKAMAVKAGLEADGKQVRAWSYSEVEMSDTELSPSLRVLNNNHLNFFFLPKKYILDDYLGYPADWLLDLSQRANPVTEYLTAVSQAPFRTGFKVDCPRIYDFVLDIRPTAYDLQENAASLLFYLRNLKLKN
ncbi:MAG: hypothetical protein IJR64_07565 [Bacteroidales bacterium]|nr:hypothetical protein [Bacteroidales bacterium]